MKKTLADFIVKSLEAASVKVGEMYRVKKEYGSGERSWDYIANSELVKMSTGDEWASDENPMCYFLVYELKMHWFQPSTLIIKWLLNDIEIVEITAEQLKELQEAETKDLETEDEEDGEEDKEENEKEEADNSQEQEVLWNEDGDTPEKGDAGEGEKMITLTKDLETKDKTIGELQAKVKELEDEKAEVQKENEEMTAENEQLKADLDEAQKAFFEVNEAYTDMKGKYETAGKTLAAVRWIKVEYGLKQMEDQEVKKGNVAVAFEEAIKQL